MNVENISKNDERTPLTENPSSSTWQGKKYTIIGVATGAIGTLLFLASSVMLIVSVTLYLIPNDHSCHNEYTPTGRCPNVNLDVPFCHVPDTISPLAQEFLKVAVPAQDNVSPPSVLEANRKGFEKFATPGSEAAKKEYIKTVSNIEIKGVNVTEATPTNYDEGGQERIVLYFHGGGYIVGAPSYLFQFFAPVAHYSKTKAFAPDYRLAPEHPFPAAVNDTYEVYKSLVTQYDPSRIVLLGDSAGGGLVLTTLMKARDEGNLPMPAAIGLYTPYAELEKKGDTYYTLEGRSPVLNYEKSLLPSIKSYVPKGLEFSNPWISPINGNFSGFPPARIVTGTRDLLQSTSARLHRKFREAGIDSEIDLYEGMGHDFEINFDWPEAKNEYREMGTFFARHLPPQ